MKEESRKESHTGRKVADDAKLRKRLKSLFMKEQLVTAKEPRKGDFPNTMHKENVPKAKIGSKGKNSVIKKKNDSSKKQVIPKYKLQNNNQGNRKDSMEINPPGDNRDPNAFLEKNYSVSGKRQGNVTSLNNKKAKTTSKNSADSKKPTESAFQNNLRDKKNLINENAMNNKKSKTRPKKSANSKRSDETKFRNNLNDDHFINDYSIKLKGRKRLRDDQRKSQHKKIKRAVLSNNVSIHPFDDCSKNSTKWIETNNETDSSENSASCDDRSKYNGNWIENVYNVSSNQTDHSSESSASWVDMDCDTDSSDTNDESYLTEDDSVSGESYSDNSRGFFSENDWESYDFEDEIDDESYHLPENVLEDLIIHKGTAEKRDLNGEDNIKFVSDDEEAQIIEIPNDNVKAIIQHEAYHIENLQKLNERIIHFSAVEKRSNVTSLNGYASSDSSDCPQLLPIIKPGSQFDYSESECSSIIISSDDETIGDEEDINNKYILESEFSDMEEVPIKAVIIDARKCDYNNILVESSIEVNNDNDELPLKRIANLCNNVSSGKVEILSPTIMISEFKLYEQSIEERLSENSSNASMLESSQSPFSKQSDIPEKQIMDESTNSCVAENLQFINRKSPNEVFRSIFYNAVDSNHVLVVLKSPLYLYGTLRMTLLAGSVDVYGYIPCIGEELEIFSPRGCNSVSILPVKNQTKNVRLRDALQCFEPYFIKKDLQRIAAEFEEKCDALLLLKRNTNRKNLTNFFKRFMNENVFPNMKSIQADRPLYASEYLLHCVINFETEKILRVPKQWSTLKFDVKSKVMIVGGKAVGKSTLLRFLINRHLSQFKKVLLIDLDIGQGENFVPQTISCTVVTQPLLGPGFFLNNQPEKAYMLGHSNIVLCAHPYLSAVKELISDCRLQKEFEQMPWFVNTMGYNKGFGLELVKTIMHYLEPTDLVQLQSNKEINNFDSILDPFGLSKIHQNVYNSEDFIPKRNNADELQYRFHLLDSAILQESRYQRDWDMSAKDFRYAMILARLSEILKGNSEVLTDYKPFSVSLHDIKLVNLLSNTSMEREVLLAAMEGNLVFLCQQHDNDSKPLKCFGIGIVRAIDYHGERLFLLPAMPTHFLKNVNCLALGEMPLPTSLFTNQGSKVRNLAPFVHNTIDAKSSKSVKQIYHRPPHFFTSKRRNALEDCVTLNQHKPVK